MSTYRLLLLSLLTSGCTSSHSRRAARLLAPLSEMSTSSPMIPLADQMVVIGEGLGGHVHARALPLSIPTHQCGALGACEGTECVLPFQIQIAQRLPHRGA